MNYDEIYEMESSYHDKKARNHAKSVPIALHEVAPWRQVREAMGVIEEKRILDIGCGVGREAIWLAKDGAKVTGVDLSTESIACAERDAIEEGVKIELLNITAEEIKFDAVFDIVLCNASLHHFLDVSRVLKIAHKALKPGGLIVAKEPLRDNPFAIIGRKIYKPTSTQHPFIFGELDAAFDNVFSSHESRYFCLLSPMHIPFPRTGRLSQFSFKFFYKLDCLLLPSLKRWAWIQVIWATK